MLISPNRTKVLIKSYFIFFEQFCKCSWKLCFKKVPEKSNYIYIFFIIITSIHETYVPKKYHESPKFQESSRKTDYTFFEICISARGTYVAKSTWKVRGPKIFSFFFNISSIDTWKNWQK